MQENEILDLVEKYLSGTATPEEQQTLLQWYRSNDHSNIEVVLESAKEKDAIKKRIFKKLQSHIHHKKPTPIRKIIYRTAAVAAIIILAFGVWFIFNKNTSTQTIKDAIAQTGDIPAPKDSRAVITLVDGKKIFLDSITNGTIAQQYGTTVTRNESGEIVYTSTTQHFNPSTVKPLNSPTLFNTMSNPRGSRVIPLTLSDGTKVWLNSESSIKYPVAFNSNTRVVEITGEAYFEVAHDASRPFHVKKEQTDITVLGTRFNVNGYNDEDALRVTLLEGSVKVSTAQPPNSTTILKPGEQAIIAPNAKPQTLKPDLDEVMAWKNGLFQMNSTDVATIMRQISRWYDVDVVYQKGIPGGHITGKVPRDINLSNVLKVLEYSGIRFSIEEKKIIVKP